MNLIPYPCVLLVLAALFPSAVSHAAQATAPTVLSLELPRFQAGRKPELSRVNKTKVTLDELLPQGAAGVRNARKQSLDYLVLEPARVWARPLRGSPQDITFVSFLAYASEGSVFEIGGARLDVRLSAKPGYAQVTLGLPAVSGGLPVSALGLVKIERHDSAALAALPVFTVRLDPGAGIWDLYQFQQIVATDLPLSDNKGARRFNLTAGKEGAWLCALVLSDENPLFVDANANGIDDTFEKQKRGALLAVSATAAERRSLASEWKDAQALANLKPWKFRRLVPDNIAGSR